MEAILRKPNAPSTRGLRRSEVAFRNNVTVTLASLSQKGRLRGQNLEVQPQPPLIMSLLPLYYRNIARLNYPFLFDQDAAPKLDKFRAR